MLIEILKTALSAQRYVFRSRAVLSVVLFAGSTGCATASHRNVVRVVEEHSVADTDLAAVEAQGRTVPVGESDFAVTLNAVGSCTKISRVESGQVGELHDGWAGLVAGTLFTGGGVALGAEIHNLNSNQQAAGLVATGAAVSLGIGLGLLIRVLVQRDKAQDYLWMHEERAPYRCGARTLRAEEVTLKLDHQTTVRGVAGPGSAILFPHAQAWILAHSDHLGPTSEQPAVLMGGQSFALAWPDLVDVEEVRAISLKRACEGGNMLDCSQLGVMYETGEGAAKDEARAVALFKQACEGGNMLGCSQLGVMYETGEGAAKDEVRAVALFKQACEGGNMLGCSQLGVMYAAGRGATKDESRAVALFKQACEGGNMLGCSQLGVMYAAGRGATKDESRAVALFKQACDGGYTSRCEFIQLPADIRCEFRGLTFDTTLGKVGYHLSGSIQGLSCRLAHLGPRDTKEIVLQSHTFTGTSRTAPSGVLWTRDFGDFQVVIPDLTSAAVGVGIRENMVMLLRRYLNGDSSPLTGPLTVRRLQQQVFPQAQQTEKQDSETVELRGGAEADPIKITPIGATASNTVASSSPAATPTPLDTSHNFFDEKHGLKVTCPKGWTFMSPAEVTEKTQGHMTISPGTLVFCVNSQDFDQNINIIYAGDTSRDAPTRDAARRFLDNFRKQAGENLRRMGMKLISSRLHEIGRGVGLEMVNEGSREGTAMKSKLLLIISHGKGYTITCTARKTDYDNANRNAFVPTLSSISIE